MTVRSRRYLPHVEYPGATYFVTFRLSGSLPKSLIDNWNFERAEIQQEAKRQNRNLSEYENQRITYLYRKKAEEYLDHQHGDC